MDSFEIQGGCPLKGEVTISGSKNSVLAILAATLLTRETCTIRRVPNLSDVRFMGEILKTLGAHFELQGDTVTVKAEEIGCVGDYELIRKMRGSICILGPLLGRLHRAQVSLPGGCVIGARPIDLHLKGLVGLGADITIDGGYVHAEASNSKLQGDDVFMGGRNGPTVLGTANVMMAATLAKGTTTIQSAACEPEIVDLADFLTTMGARISGAGSPTIEIKGVEELHGTEHEVIPDRIESGTFAIAAAATNGDVTIKDTRADHFHAVLDKLREAGVKIERNGKDLRVRRNGPLSSVELTTQPYAGFPTDLQAQMMALMTLPQGISIITERIFESRFIHVSELERIGADVAIEGPSAIVKGGRPLSGAPVMASDLRASAALVIAGLAAEGTTLIHRVYHIDRGYENIDAKLGELGANIKRVRE